VTCIPAHMRICRAMPSAKYNMTSHFGCYTSGTSPVFEPMTGSLGNHLIRRPSPISWIWPVTLAHRQAALWQPPLILTTHATALLRLATARHPSAPSIPKLPVVIAIRTHAFLLLLQRSHHYTRWTSLRTSRVNGISSPVWIRCL
jgi:hypothetical protein